MRPDASEGAVITMTEMYQELRDTRSAVDRLTTIVESSLPQAQSNLQAQIQANSNQIVLITAERKAEVRELDRRLRIVERGYWVASTLASAAGAIGGYVLSRIFGG